MKIFFTIASVGIMAVLAAWIYARLAKARRKQIWRELPVSDQRQQSIRSAIELFQRMPDELWQQLLPLLQVFQNQISWEACGGLDEVTQEMRDVISAQACLLVVANQQPLYPRLKSVLIYPEAYSTQNKQDGSRDTRLGESWSTGSLILSWKGVKAASADADDGFNLVIHEFAHQLDQINGSADGLPNVRNNLALREWAKAFSKGFEHYCAKIERGQRSKIDDYAATNEAEFFAVLSEVFFERPDVLVSEYPEIYKALKKFYGVDALNWL